MKLSNKEKTRLKNKYGPWALITGSSSGIGLALAERLAESGFNLLLHGRKTTELEKISTHFQNTYLIQTQIISADLQLDEGISEVIEFSKGKEIGLFIASAGFGTSGLFHQSNLEEETNMLHVNCNALMSLTHYFSNYFINKKRGGIILLSSMVGFQGVPYSAHYAATKAYVQSLGEALAVELKPYSVDVLVAAPGPVASNFAQRAKMNMNMSLTPHQVAGPILQALGKKSTVLPGYLTKLLVGALRTVPRWGKVRIMEKVMGGMTAHQRKTPLKVSS